MTNRRTNRLNELERRLKEPMRVALFGHRNVGKTTLLAVFYREASSGRIPGLRLAAADARTAEYLSEKILQIESGQPTAGSLAETDLKLRLYNGSARFDLVLKDYQGEHVTLGMEEPIQEFFADCDAVFLCLDPEGTIDPAQRRQRQQEVENLLERYIHRSIDLTTDRPVALLLTKFDRVLASAPEKLTGELSTGLVEQLVGDRYSMTQHALAAHAPAKAIFAVSAFGPGAIGNRPPAEIQPIGLEGPLSWLAEQLEARDQVVMAQLWEEASNDLPRLQRSVADFERRHPHSKRTSEYRSRLNKLAVKHRRRVLTRIVAFALMAVAAMAGYDALAYREAIAYEQQKDRAAPAIERRWADLLTWHPSMGLFWPDFAREARVKRSEWQVRAAEIQVANGTATVDLPLRLSGLKDMAPHLGPAIRKVEVAHEQARHDLRWKTVQAESLSLAATEDPGAALSAIDAFLREFPGTPRRAEAIQIAESLAKERDAKRHALDRQFLEDLVRSESLPDVPLSALVERARHFLADHGDSPSRVEVQHRLDLYIRRLDEEDIEKARDYSRRTPSHFAARIEHYQRYLKAHQSGGRFISEAMEAKDRILHEWDVSTYRQAYDHLIAHPDDLAEVARRLREYLRDQPEGRYLADAQRYLDWWDKVSVPGQYHVTLRRGEVESTVGKYLSGAGPDLGVTLEVAGTVHGPSSVIKDTYRPIWDYTYPQPITWKVGDPVTIRLIDYDWSATEVYTLTSRPGDPLAIRLLTGTVKPSKGGKTTLVFGSDFVMPTLSEPR